MIWTVGLVMMAGSLIGANLGAKMVMAKGKTTDQTDGGDYVIYHDDKNGV